MNKLKILLLLMVSGSVITAPSLTKSVYADTNVATAVISEASSENTVSNEADALVKINEGTADFSDYKILGFNVSEDNVELSLLNEHTKFEKEFRGHDLSKDEISQIVNDEISYWKSIIDNLSSYTSITVEQYASLGVKVDEYQLPTINSYCKEAKLSTVAGLKASALEALEAITKINDGTTDLSYYKKLNFDINETYFDITTVAMRISIEHEIKGYSLSKDEIQNIINDDATFCKDIIDKLNTNTPLESYQYSHFDLKLEDYQLSAVEYHLLHSDCSTISKLKTNLFESLDAINKINDGTYDLSYYNKLDFDINEDTLDSSVLSDFIKVEKSNMQHKLSRNEISAVITNVTNASKVAVSNILNGKAEANDYLTLGISLKDNELTAANSYCFISDSSSITKIKANVLDATNCLNKINVGTTDLSCYTKLDFDFTEDDLDMSVLLKRVKSERALKGHYLSKEEILEVVNTLISDSSKAIDNISCSNGTIEGDFAVLGIKLKDYQLSSVNTYCFNNDCSNVAEVKANVSTAIDALNKINRGTTDLSYYKKLDLNFSEGDLDMLALANTIKSERAKRNHYLTREEINELVTNTLNVQAQ